MIGSAVSSCPVGQLAAYPGGMPQVAFQLRLLAAVLISLLLVSHQLSAAEPKQTKRILVLCSEDRENPGEEMVEQGIRAGFRLEKSPEVQLYTEYLDNSRFGGLSHNRTVVEYLDRKYSGTDIQAIITIYPYAVQFLLEERPALFSGLPIIAAAITRSQAENLEYSPARRFVTGTIVGDTVTGAVEAALRLRPETKHVALISGTSPTDILGEQPFRLGFKLYAEKIDLIDLTRLSMDETLSRVGSLPPDTIAFYGSILRDGAGRSFVPRDALPLIARASKAPVFGVLDPYLGFGIVGGPLESLSKHGTEAAAMALRVLEGESPASIPFGGKEAYVTVYDWRELKRWNIPESAILAGAEIRYRVSSFWEEYRWGILGAITIITLETGLILGLLVNFQRRRKAERSLRRDENELRALTGRLINAREEELRRLSRDLHDDLTQRLAALAIDAGMLQNALKLREPDVSQIIANLKAGLIEISDDVHSLSRQLHPSILDDLGLVQAIRSECEVFSRRTGIAVSFDTGDFSVSVPKDNALCLYRILQESLQNISKHSGAKEARVDLRDSADGVHLSVRDPGVGFDVRAVSGKGTVGLASMRERLRLLGGTASIQSAPGKGTELQIFIPKGGRDVEAARADRG